MRIPQRFYARDVLDVAPQLLGMELRRDRVRLKITEVEAYRFDDTACHARAGRTERNEAMWGPPGRAYVYVCYGQHQMLNIVTNQDGVPSAVLIRACEIVAGHSLVAKRRRSKRGITPSTADPKLLAGPGKVGQALDLATEWSGHRLYSPGGLELHRAAPPDRIARGSRIGIDYADPKDRKALWRFAISGCPAVSHPKGLQAL